MIFLILFLQFTLTIEMIAAGAPDESARQLTSVSSAKPLGRNVVTVNSEHIEGAGQLNEWSIGNEWHPSDRVQVTHNGSPAELFRFTRTDGENNHLGGEHISLTFDAATGLLLGLMRMERRFFDSEREGPLPGKSHSQRVADAFLVRHAPDLLERVRVLWIEPHEEVVTAEEREVVTGMKVKMRQDDGRYAWVIVGTEGEVITFERDIVWNTSMSERSTEKWLHDEWRVKR